MLNRLPLWRMKELLERGEVSAGQLIEAHLEEIERTNPRVNAFIEVYAGQARARAREALRGPLAGLPVTVKDSFDMAGRVTWCGSLLRREAVAARDSTAVGRLQRAGAVILARTSTPEFLYYYETDNRIIGRTNHPWDGSRTPGGSSGGEAAAIASFMSAGGLGSDGGGSIREPAHFCGICGLKPTPGRVGAGGHWPEIGHPAGFMGVCGPLARCARDLKLLFETLACYDVRDPFSAPVPVRRPESRPARVSVWRMEGVQAACAGAVERAAQWLGQMGYECEEFDGNRIRGAHELWRVLFVDLITQSLRPMIRGREEECAWTGLELMARARGPVDAGTLAGTLAARDRMRAELLEWMGAGRVILAPAFGVGAFPHRQAPMDILEAARPVTPWNLLGMPGVVLPAGVDEAGMPVGVQLAAAPFDDERLLELAERLEEARGDQWQNIRLSPTATNSTISQTGCG